MLFQIMYSELFSWSHGHFHSNKEQRCGLTFKQRTAYIYMFMSMNHTATKIVRVLTEYFLMDNVTVSCRCPNPMQTAGVSTAG